MELYSLLFTNESAQTMEGSQGKGIVALKTEDGSLGAIVLLSAKRVMNQFRRFVMSPSEKKDSFGYFQEKAKKISNDAIVGHITYTASVNPVQVSLSSGVNKFGPLAYQLAMYAIRPKWLQSDALLSFQGGGGGSQNVWNKMYELSNQGVYKRKWLGSFDDGKYLLYKAKKVNDSAADELEDYNPEEDPSEETFLTYLSSHNKNPKYFGQFWAYQLTKPDPRAQELFSAGDSLVEDIVSLNIDGLSREDIHLILQLATSKFFRRRYDEYGS